MILVSLSGDGLVLKYIVYVFEVLSMTSRHTAHCIVARIV
jgi:hypothetical protein